MMVSNTQPPAVPTTPTASLFRAVAPYWTSAGTLRVGDLCRCRCGTIGEFTYRVVETGARVGLLQQLQAGAQAVRPDYVTNSTAVQLLGIQVDRPRCVRACDLRVDDRVLWSLTMGPYWRVAANAAVWHATRNTLAVAVHDAAAVDLYKQVSDRKRTGHATLVVLERELLAPNEGRTAYDAAFRITSRAISQACLAADGVEETE